MGSAHDQHWLNVLAIGEQPRNAVRFVRKVEPSFRQLDFLRPGVIGKLLFGHIGPVEKDRVGIVMNTAGGQKTVQAIAGLGP